MSGYPPDPLTPVLAARGSGQGWRWLVQAGPGRPEQGQAEGWAEAVERVGARADWLAEQAARAAGEAA